MADTSEQFEVSEDIAEKPQEETTAAEEQEAPAADEKESVEVEEQKEQTTESTEEAKEEATATATEEKKEEKEGTEAPVENGNAVGDAVAKHYNENPNVSKEGRKDSKIYYLRNFNNWVKSVMINEFLEKIKRDKKHKEDLNVLDLGCGKGGDYLKWQKGSVKHVICADIAETSLEHCKERYQNLKNDDRRHKEGPSISTEIIHADCTKKQIKEMYENPSIPIDLTSCQFAFHYSFESLEQAEMMLKNACENLRDGAYFIGTTPDAYRLVQRVKAAEGNSFGNDIYNIEFEDKENLSLFGAKYNFKLHDVVDCPEFLVYFPVLEKLAEKYNMKLVYKKNFHELFQEKHEDYSGLLYRMQALEGLPLRGSQTLCSDKEDAYEDAKNLLANPPAIGDPRYKSVGTLSKEEWEAAGLYLAFAFQKCDPKPKEEETSAQPEAQEKNAEGEQKTEQAEEAPATEDASMAETEQQEQPAAETDDVTEVEQVFEQQQQETIVLDDDEPTAKRSKPSEEDE